MIDAPVKTVTRRQAMFGARRTYVGRPCRVHGVGAKRYFSSSGCVACHILRAAKAKERERSIRNADFDLEDE